MRLRFISQNWVILISSRSFEITGDLISDSSYLEPLFNLTSWATTSTSCPSTAAPQVCISCPTVDCLPSVAGYSSERYNAPIYNKSFYL